ncbi:hypothetical protein [Paractinoplanes deccanensis]|nr:hypothetical protein [Actinoplanes deccanensis]
MLLLRPVRAAIVAVAGMVVTLAQLNLPSKEFWAGQEVLQWISVAVVAAFLFYDALWSVNLAFRDRRIREYDADLRAAMSAAVALVVDTLGVRWDEVSVQYYRYRRFWFRPNRLVRVSGVRAGAIFAESEESFRPGVGLVGAAFQQRILLGAQWGDFVQSATRLGPVAWEQRDPIQRYGLSWGQLRRSAGPDGIVASPTFAPNGRADGCLVISGPMKAADLVTEPIGQIIDSLATSVDRIGPPPPGWWSAHER